MNENKCDYCKVLLTEETGSCHMRVAWYPEFVHRLLCRKCANTALPAAKANFKKWTRLTRRGQECLRNAEKSAEGNES